MVTTDLAARAIDVQALGHVVNFDVPKAPEDYVHRVGRTERAEATGDAFTFVAPNEEEELRQIEKVIGKRLPRVTVPDFDYEARPAAKLERPIAERLAEARARKKPHPPHAQRSAPGPHRQHGPRPAPKTMHDSRSQRAAPGRPGRAHTGGRPR